MAARAALQTIQIFNPYVNQGGSFNAYSYYDHGVETQENFRDVFPVTDQCERSAQLMGDDYVRLKFNLTAYVPMAAFSFIRYDGQTFFLMNDYCPHSNGSRKIYDGQGNAEVVSDSYEYDMKFYSVANMLRKPICYRHVKVAKGATVADGYHEWDEPEITVSATLPTMYVIIVQSIARYTTRLDSNLLLTQMLATIPTNGLDNTGIAPKNTVKLTADTELATFNFNGDNIADVCTTVANAYSDAKKETEWYIEEKCTVEHAPGEPDLDIHSLTLHFCKCLDTQSMNQADDFSYKNTEGINRETHPVITGGLKKVDYSRDESSIPQVIIPYGSERNMTYQAVKGIDEVSQMQSTFGKRLRLKANHTCTINGTQYPTAAMQAKGITGAYAVKDKNNNLVPLGVDAHGGIANDQVNTGNEKVEYFDDVYPQCHFVVSKVEERSKKKDGNIIPEYTCEGIVVDAQGQIVQPEGDFYPLQIEEGKTLSVRFESGYLNGREFEIANKTQKKTNPSTGQPETNYTLRFVIVADGSIEDGTLIPSGNFKPRAREAGGYEGDKFALFNMKMPEAYITYAQEELAQKAYEKLIEYQDTVPDVKCTSDPDSFGGKDVYFGAQYTINSEKLGFTLNEQNRRVPVDFISRVVAYSYKLTKVNEVSFTLSSALVRGVLSEMAAAITNVSYATEGLGQRSINLSRRGWRDASEVADMITSMNTEMMLVGNEKYQFGYTSEILPLHTNGVFTGLKVSYGQLQHTQQPYIDYANGGLWQIQPNASLNADYQGNALDGTKPYYVFAVCGTDNLEWATVILMDKDAAETNGVYHKDAEISDQDQYPQYLLLGILSSEFAEEKNGQMTYERVFSPTCGFTAIEGGTITTEQIQDANRQLIIDFLSKPPRIIARGGAEIIGNITFKSFKDESGNNVLETLGRNLLRDTAFTKKGEKLVGWKKTSGCDIKTNLDDSTNVEAGTVQISLQANNTLELKQTCATGANAKKDTYTLSAIAKASAATTMSFYAYNSDPQTVALTTAFQPIKLSVVVADNDNAVDSQGRFYISLPAGVAGSITLKEVKLEKGAIATTWTKAPEDTIEEIQENKSYIEAVEQDLQNQIDGVVDSYFMLGVPTLNNAPAVDWKVYDEHGVLDPTETAKEYARHRGDTYTNIQNYTKLGKSAWENGFFYARQEDMNKPVNKHDNIEGENVYIRTADFIHYKEGDTLSFGTMPLKTTLNRDKYNIYIAYFGDDPNEVYSEPVLLAVENYTEGQALNANYSLCMVTFRRATIGTTFTNDPKTEFAETYGFCLNPTAGHSWRFCPGTDDDPVGTYHWHEIADSDAVKALQDAAAAQDTADGKRRVFTVQPVPPYDAGDLWANATYSGGGVTYDNVLLKCKTSKAKGQSFAIADWEDSSRAIASADAAQAAADDAMQKALDIADDGIISGGTEKTTIKKEWQEIAGSNYDATSTNGSYYKAKTQAALYGVSINTIQSKFVALKTMLDDILADMDEDYVLADGNVAWNTKDKFITKWRDYYDAEIELLNSVTDTADVGDNLCGASNPFVIPAESNNYNYRTLVGTWATTAHEIGTNPNNLEAGKTYTFALDKAELIAGGSTTKFTVCLYGLRSDNAYDEICDVSGNHIRKELNIANGRQTWTFTTPTVEWYKTGETTPHIGTQPYKAICLLIYAGQSGSTNGRSIRFTNLALYEGKYAAREWKPYMRHLSEYFENAARDADTDVDGGIVATSLLKMRYWTGKWYDPTKQPSDSNYYANVPDYTTTRPSSSYEKEYVYTAGLSGLKDDDITLWGGGSYALALLTLAGQATTPIPVLLTKKGAGSRIGCFKVDDEKTVKVVTDNNEIVITNDTIANAAPFSPSTSGSASLSFTKSLNYQVSGEDQEVNSSFNAISLSNYAKGRYSVTNAAATLNCIIRASINRHDPTSFGVRVEGSISRVVMFAKVNGTEVASINVGSYDGSDSWVYGSGSGSGIASNDTTLQINVSAKTLNFECPLSSNSIVIGFRIEGSCTLTEIGSGNNDGYGSFFLSSTSVSASLSQKGKFVVIAKDGIAVINSSNSAFYLKNSDSGYTDISVSGLPDRTHANIGSLYLDGEYLKRRNNDS